MNSPSSNKVSTVIQASCESSHQLTPPYLTTTVFPLNDLAASETVSTTSEKFSATAESDIPAMFCDDHVVDGDVKAEATEIKSTLVMVESLSDFMVSEG